jgi:predicted transposase YbfD/YdcC
MGCQKATTKTIIEQEANYVIALKGNQDTLIFQCFKQGFREGIIITCQVPIDHKPVF